MAQNLAPYNNSMRLGQGFNSYTQQICLDRAVLPDTAKNQARLRKERITLAAKKKSSTKPKPSEAPAPKALEKGTGSTSQSNGEQNVDTSTEIVTADPETLEQTASEDFGSTESAEEDTEDDSEDDNGDAGDRYRDTDDYEDSGITVQPWVKPQIVTYSSRFVDKLSDVTDAMNISGSLSIKTATIGGKASGSYVDSDKFKSSDINFHLQVKVTNQILDAENYNIFNKIKGIDENKFPEVYGDSFISGWEEGGELNAIISIKVLDKSKIFQVKASIEAELTTPGISGKVTANVDINKSSLAKETETTMAVNWSGGGSIKNPQEDWSIDTLKKAAAAFPECVAITPQRTYAILTKYTALESFHIQNTSFKPLDYENAGIYTGALLDAYMDYKSLWKQISHAIYELEGNRATIDRGEPSEEMAALARVRDFPLVDSKTNLQLTASTKKSTQIVNNQQLVAASSNQGETAIPTFAPTFAGLISARKVCRFEMSKIVREVDLVSHDPTLSTDPSRDSYFLHPLVFKQLLPLVRSLSPENASLGVRDPSAALLLGYSQPKHESRNLSPVYILEGELKDHALPLRQSIDRFAHKAQDYRLQGCVGPVSDNAVPSQAKLFNDLEKLDQTYRPTQIAFWNIDGKLAGIQMQYANGEKKRHGVCVGSPSHVLPFAFNGSEVIVEIVVREAVNIDNANISWIESIAIATSHCNVIDTGISGTPLSDGTETTSSTKNPEPSNKTSDPPTKEQTPSEQTSQPKEVVQKTSIKVTTWTRPEDPRYSLRGFFGFAEKSKICTLGVVWGKDSFVPVPAASMSAAISKNFLDLSRDLQNSIRGGLGYAGKFFLGASISTGVTGTPQFFNAMDTIDVSWEIKSIGFASAGSKLCGLKTVYRNGREVTQGIYTPETVKWTCETRSELSIVRITAGKLEASGPSYIDTMEFIRGDDDGTLPVWPLHMSTVRYLGEGDERVSRDVRSLVETAPKIANSKWCIRGFYGECSDGLITRLGVIWGRDS